MLIRKYVHWVKVHRSGHPKVAQMNKSVLLKHLAASQISNRVPTQQHLKNVSASQAGVSGW